MCYLLEVREGRIYEVRDDTVILDEVILPSLGKIRRER